MIRASSRWTVSCREPLEANLVHVIANLNIFQDHLRKLITNQPSLLIVFTASRKLMRTVDSTSKPL